MHKSCEFVGVSIQLLKLWFQHIRKKISNESCQRSIKNTRYEDPFSIENLKNRQAKFEVQVLLQCQQKHQSKLGVTEIISIWQLTKNASKTTSHCFFLRNKMVLQQFLEKIHRISALYSIVSYKKRCIFRDYLVTDRQTR